MLGHFAWVKNGRVLTLFGFTVDVIRLINTSGVHNSDFLIDGVICGVKSPEGKSRNTIERKYHEASKQFQNLIMDAYID